MSESSLPLTTPLTSSGTATETDDGTRVLDSLAPLLGEWLPHQRWFAGKGRPITGWTLVSLHEILPVRADSDRPGLLHLLLRARQPAPAGQSSGPTSDCYQLLLGVRHTAPAGLRQTPIGRPGTGPLRGLTVYDALHDPRLAALWLERLRTPGRLGALRFTCASAATGSAADGPGGLEPRLLEAEQSNSSVIYGSSLIFKMYRRVGAGINPDLELPLALSLGGNDRVPAPVAWFEAESSGGGSPMTLGLMQPFLAGSSDGWQLALRAVASGEDFTATSRALGQAVAEVHTTLAERLPTSTMRHAQLEQLAAQMTERLTAACAAVPALRPYRAGLRGAFTAVADLARRNQSRQAQRIHGDLHLGQVLRSAGGHWALIDFEGEPARPMSERRRLQPVVRDVAGMLRSYDYAAAHHGAGETPSDSAAQTWARDNRAAYCEGYASVTGTDPREDTVLLRAFETDKAVYEVLYEARNRPAWLAVPMSAVRRLAATPQQT